MRCDEGIDWIYREVSPRLGSNHKEAHNKELLLIVNVRGCITGKIWVIFVILKVFRVTQDTD